MRERFFKGGDFHGLPHLRSEAQAGVRGGGMRIHGTTRRKPLVVFQDDQRDALLPWDGEPYEIADWRNAKVHPDHHIQWRPCIRCHRTGASAGGNPAGQQVGDIYHRGQLIKSASPRVAAPPTPTIIPPSFPPTPPERLRIQRSAVTSGGG